MTLYCGIDLHANNSVVSVWDEQDPVRFLNMVPQQTMEDLAEFDAEAFVEGLFD